VDSAEADQVGSQRFRFCAYVGLTIDEGVRHYRTTPGAFFTLRVVFLLEAAAATAQPVTIDPQVRSAPAPSAGLPRRATSLRIADSSRAWP
jgi:hypothetical protein